MSLRIRPIAIKAAQRFVRAHHRKLPRVAGGLWVGASLRALALRPQGLTRAQEWDRPSRPREAAVLPEKKVRWDLLAGEAA